jgi:hypothetical protein
MEAETVGPLPTSTTLPSFTCTAPAVPWRASAASTSCRISARASGEELTWIYTVGDGAY